MNPSDASGEIDSEERISARCLGGHKFEVGKDDIATSKSGKSFIALCPKCGKAARLRRDLVLHLFGVNARDPHQVAGLLDQLSGNKAESPEGSAENAASQDSDAEDLIVKLEEEPDYDSDDDDGGDYSDDEEDEEDEEGEEDDDFSIPFDPDDDDEHEAEIEEVNATAGEDDTVKRYRIERHRDSRADNRAKYSKEDKRKDKPTGRRMKSKPRRNARRVDHYGGAEKSMPERPARRRGVPMFDDKPLDRNELLKKIIAEEIGTDNDPYNRMAAMIDLQPEGVHPVYAESVLKLHFSPQMVAALIRRWESDTAIASAQKMKEQEALNMLQTTSIPYSPQQGSPGLYPRSIQMPPQPGSPYPPAQPWAPWLDSERLHQRVPQDPYSRPGYGFADVSPAGYPQSPSRSQYSEARTRQMIEGMIEERFDRLERALLQSKKEEMQQQEIKELRELIVKTIADRNSSPPVPVDGTKQMDSLLNNQSNLLTLLMKNILDTKDKSDPTQMMMLNEIRSLSEELKKIKTRPL